MSEVKWGTRTDSELPNAERRRMPTSSTDSNLHQRTGNREMSEIVCRLHSKIAVFYLLETLLTLIDRRGTGINTWYFARLEKQVIVGLLE